MWKLQHVCLCVCLWFSSAGKIISIETSALRATGRPGWEDLVRKCIYAFFQPQGKEPSHAKKLLHEGEEPQVIIPHSQRSFTSSVPALGYRSPAPPQSSDTVRSVTILGHLQSYFAVNIVLNCCCSASVQLLTVIFNI